jgi:hypothetical protein
MLRIVSARPSGPVPRRRFDVVWSQFIAIGFVDAILVWLSFRFRKPSAKWSEGRVGFG